MEGKYIGITDFIYSLEDDNELKFEIKDFKISSDKITSDNTELKSTSNSLINQGSMATQNSDANTTNQQTTTTNNQENTQKKGDGITLYATFTVENVGINLNE